MDHIMTRVSLPLGAGVALLGLSPAPLLAAGEGGSGSALFNINVGLSLWAAVVFLALLLILWRFAWGPILDQVEARHDRIQGALDESARKQEEAERLLAEHKQQLSEARRQAQEIVAEGKAAGEKVRKEIEAKAREEGQALLEQARRDIRHEKEAALDEIRQQSVELALAAAGRLMEERMDREKDRKLVLGYLDEIAATDEVPEPGAPEAGAPA